MDELGRLIALETFRHIHALSLRYHITRKTGGLSRIIERGVKGVDFLLRFMLLSIGPLILELTMVTVIFALTLGIEFFVSSGSAKAFLLIPILIPLADLVGRLARWRPWAIIEAAITFFDENGVEQVVFDRGGYTYGGRIAALADAAREGGLKF